MSKTNRDQSTILECRVCKLRYQPIVGTIRTCCGQPLQEVADPAIIERQQWYPPVRKSDA